MRDCPIVMRLILVTRQQPPIAGWVRINTDFVKWKVVLVVVVLFEGVMANGWAVLLRILDM
ncbi:hypothetical protein A2U01_0074571, partial [Trifolium medium]|nr:hypothetical protein [Trifolium medium]